MDDEISRSCYGLRVNSIKRYYIPKNSMNVYIPRFPRVAVVVAMLFCWRKRNVITTINKSYVRVQGS